MPANRAASPTQQDQRPTKRSRTDNAKAGPSYPDAGRLHEQYEAAKPYKHISVAHLFGDELLEGVVLEANTVYGERGTESALPGWGFERKETDIYKIQQTPDLTSLDPEYLPEGTLAKLPHLCKLKEKLYSSEFRSFIQAVTGCGPLSQSKVDGSVGLYTQGSHLLLHDDSISTRVVSYILYLPNSPLDAPTTSSLVPSGDQSFLKGWLPEWGGALELYPVATGAAVGPPEAQRSHKVDVEWGNMVIFEVQPGCSYHSVEEVAVGDGRKRLGVSGWFHKPVEGEAGYVPFDETAAKASMSSLAQITSTPPLPLTPYPADEPMPTGLTASHLKFLSRFLSPSYLSASNLERLAGQFVEGSEVVMHNFLNAELAAKIKDELRELDDAQYAACHGRIPPQDFGITPDWTLQGPASKHRYLALSSDAKGSSTPTMQSLLSELYTSAAFRAWLQVVSSLVVLAHSCEARRFRKGLDYTLASGEGADGQPRLDGTLGLSWWGADKEQEGDDEQDVGAWECYVASPEDDSDPAVYQSKAKPQHKAPAGEEQGSGSPNGHVQPAESSTQDGPKISMNGVELEFDQSQLSPSDFDTDSEAEDDDDGPLIALAPGFNQFLLVLRDPGVMRFVKYVSNMAQGSRWDLSGEWEVGQLEEDEEGAPQ